MVRYANPDEKPHLIRLLSGMVNPNREITHPGEEMKRIDDLFNRACS